MAWGRLDDQANTNGKLLALSDPAWRMWGCGLIYCQANLTDGFIPAHAVHTFGVRARNKTAALNELCRSLVPGKGPCWERVPNGGFQVHDYLDWNDSREDILRERALSKNRFERYKKRSHNGVVNALETTLQRTSTPTPTSTLHEEREANPNAREARFERFWEIYPRKVSRASAERAFRKLNPDDELLTLILLAVDRQAQSDQWRRNQGQFIPHPATWLNNRRWEDQPADPGATRVEANVRALCVSAGLSRYDIDTWFAGATLTEVRDDVTLALGNDDSTVWVQRHYAERLEQAARTAGASTFRIGHGLQVPR